MNLLLGVAGGGETWLGCTLLTVPGFCGGKGLM